MNREPGPGLRRGSVEQGFSLLHRTGAFTAVRRLLPPSLTVLTYHRVTDLTPGFDTFTKIVSATPAAFAEQMRFVGEHFDVVAMADVLAWLRGDGSLPRYPLLITFDDGYRDNLTRALPVLRRHGFPSVLFVATSCIGSRTPFHWDLTAHCFAHTTRAGADLPLVGPRAWTDDRSREAVMLRWMAVLKSVSDDEKEEAVRALPSVLEVVPDARAFEGLHLTWDEVREMAAAGVDIQAHTVNHPILTRVPLDRARAEAVGSKVQVEKEVGSPVRAFAFPNGSPCDSNPDLEAMLSAAGFEAAFILESGPHAAREVRRRPMRIRRVAIHQRDTLPRFAAKAAGMARVVPSMA